MRYIEITDEKIIISADSHRELEVAAFELQSEKERLQSLIQAIDKAIAQVEELKIRRKSPLRRRWWKL